MPAPAAGGPDTLETCFAPSPPAGVPRPPPGLTDVPLLLDAVRILVLVVVLVTVPLAEPHPDRAPTA